MKVKAQALTEFALTLTVLLMVVYGLLETGRLLFIYASTVTAARQAVRYGSTTGINDSGIRYYRDCDGIRAAVHNVGFINRFDDSDILIAYDRGVNSDGTIKQISSPDPDCDHDIGGIEIQNGDRIRVHVSTEWEPIVPIVPLKPFTITAESTRTILVSISIQVTAAPAGWNGTGNGELTLDVSALPTTFDTPGQTVTYYYTVTNTGDETITGSFVIADSPVTSNNCTAVAPAALGVGAAFGCTGTYVITQQDLDSGFVTDVAHVTAPLFSNQDGVTITAIQQPELHLVTTGTPEASAVPGTIVYYTYTMTNSGNVALRTPYAIHDDKSNDESCPQTPSTLAPGESIICTATTTIQNSDVNAGSLVNHATATALFNFTTVTSNVASFTVFTPPFYMTITVDPLSVISAGQTITYTYHLKNITDKQMKAPYTVMDSLVTNENCSTAVSPLPPGATINCTGSYVVTQADIDAGLSLTNTVVATSKQDPGNKTRSSQYVVTTVAITQAPDLTLSVNAIPAIATTIDTEITYTFTLTNSGNVTLSPPFTIVDDIASTITCADPYATIAPGAMKTCTGTHTITQEDLDDGSVINQATASAMFGLTSTTFGFTSEASSSQTTPSATSNQVSATVITFEGNRLDLTKTANFSSVTGTGQVITYTYTLHNTGNTPLTNFVVIDDKVPNVDCLLAVSPLEPGGITMCTGTYITTFEDVTAGSVTNQATAIAQHESETVISNMMSTTVIVNSP